MVRMLGAKQLYEVVFNYSHYHVMSGMRDLKSVRFLSDVGHLEHDCPVLVAFQVDALAAALRLSFTWRDGLLSSVQLNDMAGDYRRALAANDGSCHGPPRTRMRV